MRGDGVGEKAAGSEVISAKEGVKSGLFFYGSMGPNYKQKNEGKIA